MKKDKLSKLRNLFEKYQIDAYFVPSSDAHNVC